MSQDTFSSSFKYHTPAKSSLIFRVKACSDAAILLTDHFANRRSLYEVVIGVNNTLSSIRRLDLNNQTTEIIVSRFIFISIYLI